MRVWSVSDGHLLVTADAIPGCGCTLHYARVPLSDLWEFSLSTLVRSMQHALDKAEGTCPYSTSS